MKAAEILQLPRTLRWLIVSLLGCLTVTVALVLTGNAFLPAEALRGLVVLLMALAVYLWVLDSLVWAASASGVVIVMALWFWASRQAAGFGFWTAGFGVLLAVSIVERLHRAQALQRLQQNLEELKETQTQHSQETDAARQAREALEKKVSRYQQLQSIAERLSSLTDMAVIAQFAVEQAFSLIGKSDTCLLFLLEPGQQSLSLVASKKREAATPLHAKQGDSFDQYVVRTQKPLLVNEIRRDYRFTNAVSSDRSIASLIAAPLMMGEHLEGLLRLDSVTTATYTQDDLRLLDILVDLVATAMTNARLFGQIQQLAITDSLTGLLLRRPWLEQFNRELSRSSRAREPVGLLILDVDHFKRYNDTYGHLAGDAVLRLLAELLQKALPAGALIARYGGEEFTVVLPRTSLHQAQNMAEHLRAEFERATIPASSLRSSERTPVTVSIGVAVFPDDAQVDVELIRIADQRLYEAKNSGRNRVCAS